MLINLSNHPSSVWQANQLDAAQSRFGKVVDLPFPVIDPLLPSSELDRLVEDFEIQIRKLNPLAVHLMGEFVFCYRLGNRLKAIGILVVASTTQRQVIYAPDGEKTSVFTFVQFRTY